MAGAIPFLSFDSADVPAGEGRARWMALVGAYDVTLPDGCREADFTVSSASWLLGDMVVTHGRLTPVELRRSVDRIAADGRDTFTFGLVTRGHLAGDFDGRSCDLRPGQVCVIDFSRPWRACSSHAEFILLAVPRAALMALAPHARDLHGRLLDGATARILAEHFAALTRHLPEAGAADAPVIRRSTLRMIAESLDGLTPDHPDARGLPHERVADRVRRHVEAGLGTADLSPEAICKALGISRPTLYRAFKPSGGVGRYVQRRRLEAVHVLLSDPAEVRGLAELAQDFGFSSHAHFSTAFRRRFGYAPRDLRLGGGSSSTGGAALLFQTWMLELGARDPGD